MIDHYLVAASSYAEDIDNLVLLVAVLVGVWFVLVEIVFFGFIVAFRERPGGKSEYISGEEKHQMAWITHPHHLVLVCDIFIIAGAINVWSNVKQNLPPAERTVRVVAQQWAWSFVHPGADEKLGTADDIPTVDELRLEVGKVYHYKLEARDVLHSFSVPVFRLKQDAIPGRVITGWFKAIRTGIYDIQCVEMCGAGHGLMPGHVVIESSVDHAAWVAAHTPAPLAAVSIE